MTSTRPYLIRAFHDWILDNGMTPYLLVDVSVPGTRVPAAYVRDGRIVLNISPVAVGDLRLGLEETTFSARFGGVAQQICLPTLAIQAVYARENGQGMFFDKEEDDAAHPEGVLVVDDSPSEPSPAASPATGQAASSRPSLKLVK